MKIKFIPLLIMLLSSAAYAQTKVATLSLEDAERIAFDKNPQLKIEKLHKRSADWEKVKALASHLPKLEAVGLHAFDHEYQEITTSFNGTPITMPAISPLTLVSLQASWMIFDGFKSYNEYQAARYKSQAQDLLLTRESFHLKTEIRTKFFQALGSQELVAVTDQNIQTLEQHLKDVNSRVRGGVSTRYDVLRIEVQLEEAKTDKMAAEDAAVVTRHELFVALGQDDDNRTLTGALPSRWDTSAVNALKFTSYDREDHQAEVLREKAAHSLANSSHGHWAPKISLYATQDYYNNINDEISGPDSDFKEAYQVGVNFRWNLFDGGASLASEKQASFAASESAERLNDLNHRMPVEFENWKRKFIFSVASYKARLSAIKKAEESVRLAKNGLRAGIRTSTEALDALMDLNNTKAKALRSQIDAVEALGHLELAVGHDVNSLIN